MLKHIRELVEKGRLKKIQEAVQGALDAGESPEAVLAAMTAAMDAVGERFQRNEMYIPEILVAAKTMQRGVALLKPVLAADSARRLGKFIIGTAQGDLHDIGKDLVAMMLESAGFEVLDLGVDVPARRFVEALQENPDCRLVGVSALLTTTMEAMAEVVTAVEAAGLKGRVRVMVGGAPITPDFARRIGADEYTANAAAAAQRARELAL